LAKGNLIIGATPAMPGNYLIPGNYLENQVDPASLATFDPAKKNLGAIIRTSSNSVSPIVITSPEHELETGDEVAIANVTGNTAANTSRDIRDPNSKYTVTVPSGSIVSASGSTPIVITSPNHGLLDGGHVTIDGNNAANGDWTISVAGGSINMVSNGLTS